MTWLFYVAKGYSISIVAPLVSYAESQGIRIAFFVSEKVDRVLPEMWRQFPVYTDLKSAIHFCPQFVLCPGNFVDFRLPGIKVELFHGIGIEKPVHYKIRHFFDLYLTSGPVVTDRFNEMKKKYGYFEVVETGWPKMDAILGFDSTDIRSHSNIPEDKRVVLYAPTHSKQMQSAEALLPALSRIMAKDEIWLFKPHEFMDQNLMHDVSLLDPKRFRLIRAHDITPWLHLADVMVSDTSSVVYEFMALNKPVITYRTMDRFDKGINIQCTEQLRDALDRSFSNPMEFEEQRNRHLSEVNPRLDGSVAKTIFETLQAIDPDKPLGIRRKPLNLFRKMQVLYHSRFKKGYLR